MGEPPSKLEKFPFLRAKAAVQPTFEGQLLESGLRNQPLLLKNGLQISF